MLFRSSPRQVHYLNSESQEVARWSKPQKGIVKKVCIVKVKCDDVVGNEFSMLADFARE